MILIFTILCHETLRSLELSVHTEVLHHVTQEWEKLLESLKIIETFQIPRFIIAKNATPILIQAFALACERAYRPHFIYKPSLIPRLRLCIYSAAKVDLLHSKRCVLTDWSCLLVSCFVKWKKE